MNQIFDIYRDKCLVWLIKIINWSGRWVLPLWHASSRTSFTIFFRYFQIPMTKHVPTSLAKDITNTSEVEQVHDVTKFITPFKMFDDIKRQTWYIVYRTLHIVTYKYSSLIQPKDPAFRHSVPRRIQTKGGNSNKSK